MDLAVVLAAAPSDQQAQPVLIDVHHRYLFEKLARRGSNVSRPRAAFVRINNHFGADVDPRTLKISDWQGYEDRRYSEGVTSPTVVKELTFHQAAMRHALKRERIDKVPHIEMPSRDVVNERRAATEDEYRLLMRDGRMSYRVRMFFHIAYCTGHRAQAIEQLCSGIRIDWANRVIDFNEPGRGDPTKKRNGAFPIPTSSCRSSSRVQAPPDALPE
jgi:hypothetical protein